MRKFKWQFLLLVPMFVLMGFFLSSCSAKQCEVKVTFVGVDEDLELESYSYYVPFNESTTMTVKIPEGYDHTKVVTSINGYEQELSAIGNVIGSNIFNSFFVLGCASTITPLSMGGINNVDILTMVGASVLFFITGWLYKKRTINRIEGVVMVACYIAYTSYLVMQAS